MIVSVVMVVSVIMIVSVLMSVLISMSVVMTAISSVGMPIFGMKHPGPGEIGIDRSVVTRFRRCENSNHLEEV